MAGVKPKDSSQATRRAVIGRTPVDSTRLPGVVTFAVLVTAAALAVAVRTSDGGYVAVVAVAGVLLAWGWPLLLDAPTPVGAGVVLMVSSAALAVAALVSPPGESLRWLPFAVCVGMMAAFLQQVPGGAIRPRLVDGLAITMTGITAVASGMAMSALAGSVRGAAFVGVGLAGVAAGAVAELLGRVRRVGALAVFPVMLAGALVGVWAASLSGFTVSAGVGLGMLTASFSYSVRRIFGAVSGIDELGGQIALGVGSVLLPGVLVLALGSLAGLLA
ncbi:MAG: hypothetical protein IPM08_01760 [Actinomycetales bacterium]|nr:hypothetical protein [Actinomycetales bacterium]